jgi:hypothetical protein
MRPRPRAVVRHGAVRSGHTIAVILVAAALAVSGCGQAAQSTHSSPASHGSAQPSQSAAGSSPFGGKIPVGTQLGSLLTHARLPAGWGAGADGNSPEVDSGSSLDHPLGPPSGQDSCATLGPAVEALDFIGWWAVSKATLIVQNNQNSGGLSPPIMDLTIGAYQPSGNAGRTLSAVTSLAGGCKSFTDSSGDSGTVSSAAIPQIGSQSVYLTSTVQTSNAGPIVSQVLLAQVGSYVVGLNTSTGTSAPISESTVVQFGSWLAGLVQSG